MSVTLPPELSALLHETGAAWPQADEDRLCDLAASWRATAKELGQTHAQATDVAQTIVARHQGAVINAFEDYWSQVDRHLAMSVVATDQIASGLEAMAQATLSTKSSIIDVLARGHQARTELQSTSATIAVIGPLIGLLLRTLGRFLATLIRQLASTIANWFRPAFRAIGRFLQDIIEFFAEILPEPSPEPLPPPPPPPSEPTYPRDQPLPPARELIDNGTEYTDPGKRGRSLPLESEPNSVLYLRNPPENGAVSCYTVYDNNGFAVKRVDLQGRDHGGVPTPHVVDYKVNVNPETGEQHVGQINKKKPRPASSKEIP
ncbi:hypothetical protein GIY23_15895 [Allosaccharopolyspora coralli]|uniref:Uncharacterized protein n=1 Tax=Allosaccharopolyspora coralli TaxID=2665642 RepID=A0A5Q3Q8B0_9PSEU|nr:polymorphic toxin type 24 domain-containing protein [Allosaccharopolyspora coralli]QGK70798.1 hypothetical protein GIY23_15895 [Allosaccharopolyspora coralli]